MKKRLRPGVQGTKVRTVHSLAERSQANFPPCVRLSFPFCKTEVKTKDSSPGRLLLQVQWARDERMLQAGLLPGLGGRSHCCSLLPAGCGDTAQPHGPRVHGRVGGLPQPVRGKFPPTPEAPKAPQSPQSHPACAPARGAGGIRDGSGFHKQEERMGGGRRSALKIDLPVLQRGPAPEMGGLEGRGAPGPPSWRERG